jgi:DNA-binding CsgD family transcriptional regulator
MTLTRGRIAFTTQGAWAVESSNEAHGARATDGVEGGVDAFAIDHGLSQRETEILLLLLRGVHPKAMGSELGCQYASVRTHLGRMCRKLRCSGSLELVLKFFGSRRV